ncbi:G2-specific serine/threonine protein kinase [Steccherinum ochraceum]|uniref:non-specific serine/threonine protein kinase n=1 Tax=Steccherinum ochraceum TaxID=92696 RepID=A0A4R0R308_9APHY|nr:G2-specific serine/threonine protein kinase [Steccherinum ochraceum]
MAAPMMLYEPLDVIGNGSFGIIRKVKRKSDGVVFARKELNFERMTERDRKQIVAEVNILKDLHHEHIVRYHDRYVDRDAGILYIVMEYCGGGDLSTVIKQAHRSGRPIPEDTIWSYFMQILLALNHCHHPNGHGRSNSTGSVSNGEDGKERRPQILHRDLKPDNVFLDESNTVKLGDFGLSKALGQTTFANTYVGTPYYMSPELMQEKAYDSKSDIWSLGCVIYELCALKPPFAEAKTHSELSILIRNGRIPPLPKGYSPALTSVIKAMLNLNPAMRPSASQLLQHERLTLAHKVSETEKLLATVKAHKMTVQAKERDLLAREALFAEREAQLQQAVSQKDAELASLRSLLAQAEETHVARVRAREDELKTIVMRKEAELAARLTKREEEVMEAVNRREEEVTRGWMEWEKNVREEVTRAVDERMEWVQQKAEELEQEAERLDGIKQEVEAKIQQLETMELMSSERRKSLQAQEQLVKRTPLEEVRNILARAVSQESVEEQQTPIRQSKSASSFPPVFETPMTRAAHARFPSLDPAPPSAMKGVILTQTGESLPTPAPADFAKLFVATPRPALNFAQIFDFESDANESEGEGEEGYETDTRVPSNSSSSSSTARSDRSDKESQRTPKQNGAVSSLNGSKLTAAAKPTRLRRPSIRTSASRDNLRPVISSFQQKDAEPTNTTALRKKKSSREPLSRATTTTSTQPSKHTAAEYDLSDEENLPSPFLRRVDRDRITRTSSVPAHVFPSQQPQPVPSQPQKQRTAGRKSSDMLRTLAVVNAANAANAVQNKPAVKSAQPNKTSVSGAARTAVVNAQKANEAGTRRAMVR